MNEVYLHINVTGVRNWVSDLNQSIKLPGFHASEQSCMLVSFAKYIVICDLLFGNREPDTNSSSELYFKECPALALHIE